jgi:hypothetical protein
MNKMTRKSEVYSWRIRPALRDELEAAARDGKLSLSAMLERIAEDWLKTHRGPEDAAEQRRLRAALMACAGTIKGDGISATNARVREVIVERLERKYGRRSG